MHQGQERGGNVSTVDGVGAAHAKQQGVEWSLRAARGWTVLIWLVFMLLHGESGDRITACRVS